MTPFGLDAPGSVAEDLVLSFVSFAALRGAASEDEGFFANTLFDLGGAATRSGTFCGRALAVTGASGGVTATGSGEGAGAAGRGEGAATPTGGATVEDEGLLRLRFASAKAATPSSATPPKTNGSLLRP